MMMSPLVGLMMLGRVGLAADSGVITPDQIPADAKTGTLAVEFSAQGGEAVDPSVEGVRLKVDDIQVHNTKRGWIRLSDRSQDVDLMALRDMQPKRLARGKVYAESYDALRLIVSEPQVMVNGKEEPLRIEGGKGMARETLDFEKAFTVPMNGTRTLAVDWNLDSALSSANGRWSLSFAVPTDVRIEDN